MAFVTRATLPFVAFCGCGLLAESTQSSLPQIPDATVRADAVGELVDASDDGAADGARDAETDVGLDAPADVGLDAPADAGLDAPADVGLDAPADVGLDAPADAGLDAPADVGLDAPADVGLDVVTPCSDNSRCAIAEFCLVERCGVSGVCTPRPSTCMTGEIPVCGCDGRTYADRCVAARAGVSVRAPGPCAPMPDAAASDAARDALSGDGPDAPMCTAIADPVWVGPLPGSIVGDAFNVRWTHSPPVAGNYALVVRQLAEPSAAATPVPLPPTSGDMGNFVVRAALPHELMRPRRGAFGLRVKFTRPACPDVLSAEVIVHVRPRLTGGVGDPPLSAPWGIVPDVNNDGAADLIFYSPTVGFAVLLGGTTSVVPTSVVGLSQALVTSRPTASPYQPVLVGRMGAEVVLDSRPPSRVFLTPSDTLSLLGIGDFDADGFGDFVSNQGAPMTPQTARVIKHNGNLITLSGASAASVTPLAVGDVTGDDLADVVVHTTEPWLYPGGSGSSISPRRIGALIPGPIARFRAFGAGDVTGDGRADLAVLEEFPRPEGGFQVRVRIVEFAGVPPAARSTLSVELAAGEFTNFSDVAIEPVGDFIVGDGRDELILWERGTQHIKLVSFAPGAAPVVRDMGLAPQIQRLEAVVGVGNFDRPGTDTGVEDDVVVTGFSATGRREARFLRIIASLPLLSEPLPLGALAGTPLGPIGILQRADEAVR